MEVHRAHSSIKLEKYVRDRTSLRTLRQLALQLRREALSGPSEVANATAKALRTVVSAARFQNLDELIVIIRSAGAFLQDSQPNEQTIGNITRRVLHLLREEARAANIEISNTEAGLQTHHHNQRTSGFPSTSVDSSFDKSSSTDTSTPTTATHSRNPSAVSAGLINHKLSASSAASSQSYLDSSRTSTAPGSPSRPALSAFRPGSTFSISDLVAAGAGASSSANASSFAVSPAGSGATTPAWGNASLDRLGYGVERLNLHNDGIAEETNGEDDDDEEEDEEDEDEDVPIVPGIKSKKTTTTTGSSHSSIYQLKPLLIQAMQELIDELETVNSNIAKDARDHIHSGEVIFTIGYSETVEVFLKAAAKDRKFTVIVAEAAPTYSGHKLAKTLSSAGVSTLLVPDSSTFTLMPRISKILMGAHCILANGGLLAIAGARMVAEAARAHSTPTVVLAGVYKVCPDWSWVGIATSLVDRSEMAHSNITASAMAGSRNESVTKAGISNSTSTGISSEASPLDVIPLDEAEEVEVVNPIWDYVDPEMIDLLITNVGEHPISLVYRLLSENYDAQDLVLA